MASKRVKVYPYQVKLTYKKKGKKKRIEVNSEDVFNIDNFRESFKIDKLGRNIVELVPDVPFLLIIDKNDNDNDANNNNGNGDNKDGETNNETYKINDTDNDTNDFLFGRLIRLRKEVPRILNLATQEERIEILEESENLEEISHFVWNLNENLLLAEYNYYAVRNFSAPLTAYLTTIINKHKEILTSDFKPELKVEINSILDPKVFEKLKKDKSRVTKIQLSLAEPKVSYIDNALNQEPADMLRRRAIETIEGESYHFNFALSSGHGKGKGIFNTPKLINFAETSLKDNKDIIKGMRIETETSAYDLIRHSLYYIESFEMDGKIISDSSLFYNKAVDIYNEHYIELTEYIKL